METPATSAVTGAFGYTGRSIARMLLAAGGRVVTLTAHPRRLDPLADRIAIAPLDFERPDELARSLQGAEVLYNTYWVRFPRRGVTYERAVENSRRLFAAAKQAGVRRIVHVSIANPSADSPLPYYRGKAAVEAALADSGLSHAIVRPTVIFGPGDILINNIAWFLRKFPVFAVPGSGRYPIQPIFVEDFAEIAVRAGGKGGDLALEAGGPDVFSFRDLVGLIREKVRGRARIVRANRWLTLLALKAIGAAVRDVVLTRDEVRGLTAGLLVAPGAPRGKTRLADWLEANAPSVGARYASEVERHYRS